MKISSTASLNIQKTPQANISADGRACAPTFEGVYVVKTEAIRKAFKSLGGLSTPANRMFMGATALALQPMIDLHNKDVDEKTRRISWARTIAKIIVGTATGIVVRQACIKAMDKYTRTDDEIKTLKENGYKVSKWSKLLVPDVIKGQDNGKSVERTFAEATRMLKKHRQALGSIVALGVMLFTNFLIDAPLTRILTNEISDYDTYKKDKQKGGN